MLLICLCVLLTHLGGCGGGSEDDGTASSGGGGGGGSGGGGGGATNGAIVLAWDAITQPQLAGYRVHYGTASNIYSKSVDVGAPTPSGGTVTYTLTGLTKGQTYYIAASAYDTSNIQSDLSNEVSGVAE